MSVFKVTYKFPDGTQGGGVITGPTGATVAACRKIIHLVAPNYSILPLSVSIRPKTDEKLCKGFLHNLWAKTPDGREAMVKGWYY